MKTEFSPKLGEPSDAQRAMIEEVAQKSGIFIAASLDMAIRIGGIFGAFSNGFYCRKQRNERTGEEMPETIVLCMSFSNPYANSVFFHELAHATGLETRLDRLTMQTKPRERTRVQQNAEETVAELTAMKLMMHFGLATGATYAHSLMYLGTHRAELDELALARCEKQSDDAKEYILNNWLANFNNMRQTG